MYENAFLWTVQINLKHMGSYNGLLIRDMVN